MHDVSHQPEKHSTVTALNRKLIENVKYFKFLGILFDESLTWKCHLNMVTNKIFKVIGILNRLKHVFPQNALLSIYHSFFSHPI